MAILLQEGASVKPSLVVRCTKKMPSIRPLSFLFRLIKVYCVIYSNFGNIFSASYQRLKAKELYRLLNIPYSKARRERTLKYWANIKQKIPLL